MFQPFSRDQVELYFILTRKMLRAAIIPFFFWTVCGFLSASKPASVILITVDTLRSDHLEVYGYRQGRTPATTALAEESVLFENVLVQTPLTLPSHASILTGTYPFYHGVQANLSYLRERVPTLAQWFKERGYSTGAILGSVVLLAEWGLNQGFDIYDDNFPFPQLPDVRLSSNPEEPLLTDQLTSISERSAERVVTLAGRWLEANRDGPFFLWVHFFDPHDPYNPPEPFKSEFRTRLYDGEIAYLETQLERFFQQLKELGLYESTLLVYTSDHGESLGEHKERFHAYYVYDASLRVPLMFKIPASLARGRIEVGRRLEDQVRSVDIAPTIIQLLGEKVPDYMQGESLVGIMAGKRPTSSFPAYAETHYPRYFGLSPLFSYSTPTHKYIEAPIPELYDLKKDPGELRNIFDEQSVLANQLKTRMHELQRKFAPRISATTGKQPDPEAVERLHSLGYVAFSSGSEGESEAFDLPDPKLKIDAHSQVIQALEIGRQGDPEKAIELLKEITLIEPNAPFAHFLLASEYFRAERFLLAAEYFQRALDLQPEANTGARFNLARSFFHAGLSEKAEQITREILTRDPRHIGARHLLANLLAKQGKHREAISEELAVLKIRPYYLPALNNLGSYYLEQKQFDSAMQVYQRGLEVDPNLILIRRNLTVAYLRSGRYEEALDQAQLITQFLPENGLGHYYVGQAYAGKGMLVEARKAFNKARELQPELNTPAL